ncbi:hypothetical protein ACIPY2_14390 [Paenarthrobacter sp. NPDC089675]|uniref:hypothetical protein n=1 Tax=Paenarthrobacter sp. NPDC089675 TaxID=3364376 RepID=UPI0038124A65
MVLVAILTVIIAVAGADSSAERHATASMAFGVLGATCSADRVAALRQAGVSAVELPLAWDRFEPRRGGTDRQYVADVRKRLETCRDAGLKVLLSPGLQYPPAWVRKLPGGQLKANDGGVLKNGPAEVIFSSEVREAAKEYLARLLSITGVEDIAAVRVGTNATGELGYPGPSDDGDDPRYWGFGDAPQQGKGLAAGVLPSPMPGWIPGSASWNGRAVNSRQVQEWWDWYAGAAIGAVVWQVNELRALGYQGRVQVPVAGRGVLPADKAKAIAGYLDGRANPDGAQERGLDYVAQFKVLSQLSGVDVDFTGLDDVSAVKARAALANQDSCQPGDDHAVEGDVALWSSHRYTSALARRAGLGLVGENPGPPDSPSTGGSEWSDSLADQLSRAPRYAAECGMSMFLFGFEDNLFDDGRSGVTVDDYRGVIR